MKTHSYVKMICHLFLPSQNNKSMFLCFYVLAEHLKLNTDHYYSKAHHYPCFQSRWQTSLPYPDPILPL